MTNPINSDAVAISFVIPPNTANYASFVGTEDSSGYWRDCRDFTNGEVSDGGRCELTGDREVSSLNHKC